MKVALVYDRVNKYGGAERVIKTLHEIYPKAPIYTLVHNPEKSKWSKDLNIIPSFLNKIPLLRSHHELLAPVSALAFETFNLNEFDLVISVTSESAKAVITKVNTTHICYCLTPTRYLWSSTDIYQKNPGLGIFSSLGGFVFKRLLGFLRHNDLIYSKRPDAYIAISKEVKARIKKIYKQDASLVYPSIDYKFWSEPSKNNHGYSNYYLLVSRLVPYKRTDLVIKAFNQLPQKKLLIIGTGSEIPYLLSISKKNIEFKGFVNDQDLRSYYQHAKAIILPQIEDFGLTSLEAQASGIPVIALNKGGYKETVVSGKTGVFFNQQHQKSLIKAINMFERSAKFKKDIIQKHASKFDHEQFKKKFSAKVNSIVKTIN